MREPSGSLYAFGPGGSLAYLQDPNGNRITCSYTGGRLTGLTHSSGRSLQIDYNPAGRIERLLGPAGRQTTFAYDATREHLIAVEQADGTQSVTPTTQWPAELPIML